LAKRQKTATEPKRQTQALNLDLAQTNQLETGFGNVKANVKFSSFVKPRPKIASENKAIRMERRSLLDELFKMFKVRDSWTLLELNAKVHQPIAYLKEVLDTMATLIKMGPNRGRYVLQASYRQKPEEPEASGSGANQFDGDDEEDEMEQVV